MPQRASRKILASPDDQVQDRHWCNKFLDDAHQCYHIHVRLSSSTRLPPFGDALFALLINSNLGIFSCRPYFARFSRTAAGSDLGAIQAKRTAEAITANQAFTADEVAEIGQFLATLLVLQGISGVDQADKDTIVARMRQWERTYPGRLAESTSERCLALLNDDPCVSSPNLRFWITSSCAVRNMRPMMQGMKLMLETKLNKCGAEGCQKQSQNNGDELMHCAKCVAIQVLGNIYT